MSEKLLKGESEYNRLCEIMGHPMGIPKMWLCDILHAAAFHEIVIEPILLAKFLYKQFGWDWENDNERSLADFMKEKFGQEAVDIITKLM